MQKIRKIFLHDCNFSRYLQDFKPLILILNLNLIVKLLKMKKIIILATVAVFSAGIASAQTVEEATDLYNSGAAMLKTGDNQGALTFFEQALEMAEIIGPDAMEVMDNCKDIIPKLHLQIAKDYVDQQQSDMAVAEIEKTIEIANEYGQTETVQEATELLPQVLLQAAGRYLNSKQYEQAAEAYSAVIEVQPNNAVAWLRMGISYGMMGKTEEAVEAYKKAAELGQTDQANKQLSNLYLMEAVKCQKAKDWAGVIENAETSVSYLDNYNANKLIGIAALQLGQNEKAVKGFENYLALQPNAKDKNQMYYQIATAYNNMGNKEMACTYFKMIMDDPTLGEYATHMVKNELKCA